MTFQPSDRKRPWQNILSVRGFGIKGTPWCLYLWSLALPSAAEGNTTRSIFSVPFLGGHACIALPLNFSVGEYMKWDVFSAIQDELQLLKTATREAKHREEVWSAVSLEASIRTLTCNCCFNVKIPFEEQRLEANLRGLEVLPRQLLLYVNYGGRRECGND